MYKLNFNFLNRYGDMLIDGMKTTLLIVFGCLIIGFLLGTVLALCRQSRNKLIKGDRKSVV